jgi:4'-phosphopantetheinyl transferase
VTKLWRPAPSDLELALDEVHVWRSVLDVDASEQTGLRALLSDDERTRADRFHFDVDRQRFVVGRARLRLLLARYLEVPPARIAFDYGAQGKPFVDGAEIHFNVSHSRGIALYALARRRRLGVDVEWLRPDIDCATLATRFFAPAEAARLAALGPAERLAGFFAYWTCKEAFVKALGGGLSIPLDEFEVIPALTSTHVELRVPINPAAATEWHLQGLPIDSDYRAALATAQIGDPATQPAAVRCWDV